MKVRIVGVRRVWDCMMCTSVNEEGERTEERVHTVCCLLLMDKPRAKDKTYI